MVCFKRFKLETKIKILVGLYTLIFVTVVCYVELQNIQALHTEHIYGMS